MVCDGSGGARTPPVPVTELLGSLLGLSCRRRVDVMLVVGDRGRDNRLTTGSVSAFGIFGEISGDVDCVDVHSGDLGFWFVFGINFLRIIMLHVAPTVNKKV